MLAFRTAQPREEIQPPQVGSTISFLCRACVMRVPHVISRCAYVVRMSRCAFCSPARSSSVGVCLRSFLPGSVRLCWGTHAFDARVPLFLMPHRARVLRVLRVVLRVFGKSRNSAFFRRFPAHMHIRSSFFLSGWPSSSFLSGWHAT